MKAMVTGATGFVGSHLVEALGELGHTARALARSPAKAAALELSEVEWIEGDLGNEAALRRACEGVDVVFHVAGTIAALNEAEYFAVNRDGTERMLRAAREAGASTRFVLVSSLAAAGPTVRGHPLRGHEPARPVTSYGRSKLAAETVVRDGPLPWTIVRPCAVYGPRDREMLRVFRMAARGFAPVFGDGGQEVSLIFGPDLARALIAAATTPEAVGATYFAAHPETVTTGELVRRIGRALGKAVRVVPVPAILARGVLHVTGALAHLAARPTVLNAEKANEFLQPAWTCDPGSLMRDSGWRATHDVDAGARVTIDWYRRRGWIK